MRIEKVNENQIRCFLSREELERRQLHLKELAYGTDKAKALFHELMQEAYTRFGFQADNMPVMIEAVPLFDDSLVLIVTKVDNPEELDTRFSSFAPMVKNDAADADMPVSSALGQLLDTIRQEMAGGKEKEASSGAASKTMHDSGIAEDGSSNTDSGRMPASVDTEKDSGGAAERGAGEPEGKDSVRGAEDRHNGEKKTAGRSSSRVPANTGKAVSLSAGGRHLFTFPTLGKASEAAGIAADGFEGSSALYRDPADGKYYLFVSPRENSSAADTSRLLSTLSEFGISSYITPAREQYLLEHCEVFCAQNALQKLAELRKD